MVAAAQHATAWAWAAWIGSWLVAALWSRQPARRAGFGRESAHLIFTCIGAYLLFSWPGSEFGDRGGLDIWRLPIPPTSLWTTPEAAGWALFALAVLGFAFCWWARLHLGALWSGSVTLKPEHRVVDTGPYALVRHPIYTGLILAAWATAVLKGTLTGLIGAALIVLGFWLKARLEERFLRAELGEAAYDAYAGRVGMLVPGVGRGRS